MVLKIESNSSVQLGIKPSIGLVKIVKIENYTHFFLFEHSGF